jgi:fatty acid desaturase
MRNSLLQRLLPCCEHATEVKSGPSRGLLTAAIGPRRGDHMNECIATKAVSVNVDDYSNSFSKMLPTVKNSHGVSLNEFIGSLRPKYAVVYRDIAIGYFAIAITMVLAVVSERSGMPFWVVTPITALAIGYWIAYLQLFIHEGAHWNLADRGASDLVCNRFISWWAGMEVSRYRRIHFRHHRALGTTMDSENSYFFPLNWIFAAKTLLGIRVIEVLMNRDAIAKQQTKPTSEDNKSSALGASVHREMIVGALFHLVCVGSLAWFGQWAGAAGWALGVGAVFPFFGALRQVLEHRSEDAQSDVDYRLTDHGAVSRMFSDGVLSRTLGGAGFNRHLLHHWVPTVSYTRLPDLEQFLLDTELADVIRARQTTYSEAFALLLRRR